MFIFLIAVCMATDIYGQPNGRKHNYDVIKESEWTIARNDTLSFAFDAYDDSSQALLLKRNIMDSKSASIAYPKNLDFRDGTIEADIASPKGGAGYIGLAFRIKDAHHYETVYFRPGYSKTFDAMQYMPEKKQEFNWPEYADHRYQASAVLPLTSWFHIKLTVKGSSLTVYVNNEPNPIFTCDYLDKSLDRGSVGFWLGNSSVGAYKNLVVETF
jgi:hypothetical protein